MTNTSVIDMTATGIPIDTLMDAEILPSDLKVAVTELDPGPGYCFLQVGETIQAGDEVESANGWMPVSQTFLDLFVDTPAICIFVDDVGYWRRKA